jgi:hypothetical protein
LFDRNKGQRSDFLYVLLLTFDEGNYHEASEESPRRIYSTFEQKRGAFRAESEYDLLFPGTVIAYYYDTNKIFKGNL